MRQLNKIVFINSAHIRYAEVAMDGNVHFTGTQGVGKTTLLRALLFFYNCRKDKLGIRTQGQQTFDDFYVPNASSYIVYEVSRGDEETPFSIILFRHHNRAAFRFVDAAYSKDWFVDSHGMVTSDHITVRQRIQSLGIDCSMIIDRYTQYLDILYGNRGAHLSKDLLKYYLLRTQQFQNIPRIIQNVFLNERVDAGFIKNIIINSITGDDEEIAVDLNFFRSKLTHFSDELRDISLWTEKNRQGIVETRRDADKIIATSHQIKAARFSLREQCGMLNYAISKVQRDIPILQNRITKKQEEIDKLKEKIRKQTEEYEKERRKLYEAIAVLDDKLKEANTKKKEYQRIGIDEMIVRAATVDGLKLQRQQKERLLNQLTSSHSSISEKYGLLRDRLNLDKEQYKQKIKESKNELLSDFNNHRMERLSRKSKFEKEIRERYKVQTDEIDEKLQELRDSLTDKKEHRAKIAVSSPRKEDIETSQRKIEELENKIHQSKETRLKKENILTSLKNEYALKCQQIEAEVEIKKKDIENNIEKLESQLREELQLLERSKGSLCEWLDDNVKEWEKTFGKIVDEKSVLYSQNLSPQLIDSDNDTIFGISLDLSSIEKEVRTPSMIKDSVDSLNKQLGILRDSIIQLREEKESRISEAGKENRVQVKLIEEEIDTLEQGLRIYRTQSNEELLRKEAIKEEEKIQIESILTTFDEEINELQSKIASHTNDRKNLDTICEAELHKVDKAISAEEKAEKAKKDKLQAYLDEEADKYAKEYNTSLKRIESAEATELSEAGADTQMLDITKQEIAMLSAAIDSIDRERDTIAEYRKDCREIIDKVPQFMADHKKKEDKLKGLQQKYEVSNSKLVQKKQAEEDALTTLRSACKKAEESKQEAEEYIASNECPPELKETPANPTELDCIAIISAIQRLIVEIHKQSDSLKETINEFRKRFSPNNTFKFPTTFDTLEDYHRYADSIEDFVSNDKIKEFQQMTSNLYRDILSRAASEFKFLLGSESEIIRLIKAINQDFQKKTFAGVIRSIELRLERSTTPIITQLQNITDFWNAHQLELGEVNLFSTEEHAGINKESIKYLKSLATALQTSVELKKLPLEQTFALKFRIQENDNVTDWVENIRAIGSEGTDILVKAIINILLISVFKNRTGQEGNFRLHCMMDEIGRLADENIQGILNFANQRGIYIVNSSPKAHRPLSYRRLYMLLKDAQATTIIQPILSTREAELL